MANNETIQNILTFDSVSAINQEPLMLFMIYVILLILPYFLIILWASVRKGRSANGSVTSKNMIFNLNFWITIGVLFIIQAFLYTIVLVFPIWLLIVEKFFN